MSYYGRREYGRIMGHKRGTLLLSDVRRVVRDADEALSALGISGDPEFVCGPDGTYGWYLDAEEEDVTIQNGMPPHQFKCVVCGAEWIPEPAKSGKHKGEHTDHSLNASAVKHFLECKGKQ